MSRSEHKRRTTPRVPSWRKRALFVLRIVLFALGFQVSGIAGAAVVVAESYCGDEAECELEKQGKECPPRCPQCHCSHLSGLAPASELVLVNAAAASARLGLVEPESTSLPLPIRSNPYRPPRHA